MAIQKKLLHFNDKSNFELLLERGNILDTSIVFIKDTQEIWTHGLYYTRFTDKYKELLDSLIIDNKIDKLSSDLESHKNNEDKKHIPDGGSNGLILSYKADGEALWEEFYKIIRLDINYRNGVNIIDLTITDIPEEFNRDFMKYIPGTSFSADKPCPVIYIHDTESRGEYNGDIYFQDGGISLSSAFYINNKGKRLKVYYNSNKVTQIIIEDDPNYKTNFATNVKEVIDPDNYYTKEESDSKYLTEHQDISNLATKSEIPTKTSQLTNDSNFLTEHQSLDSYYTKAETLEQVNSKIQLVVGAAPEALDTLEEIATKLNEDSDAIDAINGVLTGKVSKTGDETISGNKTFTNDIKVGTNKVWHLGNDGPDSGLDADTLDGLQAVGTLKAIKKCGSVSTFVSGLSSYWGKLATITSTEDYLENKEIDLYIHSAYNGIFGIVNINIRNYSSSPKYSVTLVSGNIPLNKVRLYTTSDPLTYELWVDTERQYGVIKAIVLSETYRTGRENGIFITFSEHNITEVLQFPSDTYYPMTAISLVNNVSSLPIPSSSNNGTILQVVNGKYQLSYLNLTDLNSYGIEWDDSISDPHCTRIGNMNLHKTLPIQSLMKGCICLGNKIMYWLDEDNWKYKKGGNPDKGETEQLARLDGYDGTVKVYVPTFYIKSEVDGTKQRVLISTIKNDDSWEEQPACLVDAYRDTILNTVPENMGYLSTLEAGTAISVVNTASYCRGGGNRDSYDTYLAANPCRSDLGKSRTSITRANARTAAVKSGGHLMSYYEYKNIMCWLYFIEYANFNALEAYNSALTSEGYHQGGMGNSMTTWDYNSWNSFNNCSQITPCGYTNEFGNKTGVKNITFNNAAGTAVTMLTNRWRGLENFFGDIWTFVDGVIIDANAANRADNMDYCYLWKDPAEFGDSMKNNYILICKSIHTEGYVKTLNLGEEAHIFANSVGGNTTQWKCDYHYVGNKDTVLRVLVVGGDVHYGGYSGPLYLTSHASLSYSWFNVGFRVITSV